jgi:Putative prokaryotic signal transducing protein
MTSQRLGSGEGQSDLVKVADAHDEAEAELIQGLLRLSDVESVVRRAPGFDVPDFLAAGPREVLVAAFDEPAARDILREAETPDRGPRPPSGADRTRRVRAALLIAVLLVVLVVCVVADVIP